MVIEFSQMCFLPKNLWNPIQNIKKRRFEKRKKHDSFIVCGTFTWILKILFLWMD